jgi:low temperature requirement protein LtrA
VLFATVYFAVRFLHVVLYAYATGRTPQTREAILLLAPGFLGGPALLIVAGVFDGFAQGVLWELALAVDYGVAADRGVSGFQVRAGRFAERHGLVVIIALGESIVAVGVGVSGLALGIWVIVAVVLGVALAAALWWRTSTPSC